MTQEQAMDLMKRFSKAFFSKSEAALAEIITTDFEWHFAMGPDAPHGRVHRGAHEVVEGIARNAGLFEYLRFEDVSYRVLSSTEILMTCRVEGKRRGADSFSVRGVEFLTVRDGKVAKKDVFWKQVET